MDVQVGTADDNHTQIASDFQTELAQIRPRSGTLSAITVSGHLIKGLR